jgi:hypothetical protein
MVFKIINFGEDKSKPDEPADIAQDQQKATAPATAPIAPSKTSTQLTTVRAAREDVVAAYKILLGRMPENMDVVDNRIGVMPEAMLVEFMVSKEYLVNPERSQLVLALAKKIMDGRAQAASTEKKDEGTT